MISNFLDRYSPPGMELKQEKRIFIWGMILSILYSIFYWSAKETYHYRADRVSRALDEISGDGE